MITEMTRLSNRVQIFYLMILCALSGCECLAVSRLHSGQRMHLDLVADLTWPGDVYIISVDDKVLPAYPRFNIYEILPGQHRLALGYIIREGTILYRADPVIITFNAEAGHEYGFGSLVYYTNGSELYFQDYYVIANDQGSTYYRYLNHAKSAQCREKLNIHWRPNASHMRWVPYIYDRGHWRNLGDSRPRRAKLRNTPLQVDDEHIMEKKDIVPPDIKELIELSEKQRREIEECMRLYTNPK